jgi:hypothetical protein
MSPSAYGKDRETVAFVRFVCMAVASYVLCVYYRVDRYTWLVWDGINGGTVGRRVSLALLSSASGMVIGRLLATYSF